MPYDDYIILTDDDYKDLPPLVKEGEDRAEVLQKVIAGCLQTEHLVDKEFDAIEEHAASLNLKRVDLRDDNPGADPIDLGKELLRPLVEQLSKSDPQKRIVVPLLGCKIESVEANELNLSNVRFLLTGSQVARAYFGGATFGEGANFDGVTFGEGAYFGRVTFGEGANFRGATFGEGANFDGVTFGEGAYFGGATFGERANFDGVTFGEGAYFRGATFGEGAYFGRVTFGEGANFRGATFGEGAYFGGVTFGEGANFRGVTFGEGAYFGGVTFGEGAYFIGATFGSKIEFYGCDLRTASLELSQLALSKEVQRTRLRELFNFSSLNITWRKKVWPFLAKERGYFLLFRDLFGIPKWALSKLRLYDLANWEVVRSLGELTILTRVSYYSLFSVPLIAGIWGPARSWIAKQNGAIQSANDQLQEQIANLPNGLEGSDLLLNVANGLTGATIPEVMPTGWLLAFGASLSIVIAQFVYQIAAPELIKNNSEQDLIDEANEINRQDKNISDERLRQAIDHLHLAADLMPHRHNAWLVKRGRRVVWIPEKVDYRFVDYRFEDAMVDEPKPDDAPEDWQPDPNKRTKAIQEVDAEDRKRITIEEGQKARYSIDSFTQRSMAWLSGGLYFLGGWLLLMILTRQFSYVLQVSELRDMAPAFATFSSWPVILTGSLIIAIVLLLFGLTVEEPSHRKESE